MHQSLPALSQRVSALEAQGYVERVPDPDDRRVIGVCVTPEGRTVMEVAYRRFGSILSPVSYTHLDVYKRQAQNLSGPSRGQGRMNLCAHGPHRCRTQLLFCYPARTAPGFVNRFFYSFAQQSYKKRSCGPSRLTA